MAEKTDELTNVDRLDPVSASAGAGRDKFLEKYDENYSETDRRELETTGDAPPETEHLKAQIEATRNQMGETIDAIQARLSLANISDQVSETVSNAIETAKDTAYDATIGKAVNFMKNVGDGVAHSSALRTVRNNPVPLALIGLGAGLLAYQAFGNGRSRIGNGRDTSGNDLGNGESKPRRLSSAADAVSGATGRAYDGISSTAESAYENVRSAAGSAYESVTGALSNAYSEAGHLTHRAYERAGEFGTKAHDKYDEYLEENPLALGAVALAVGAAVGFAIPSTRYEGQLMGEARENLMLRAQDAAGSLVEKVGNREGGLS